MSRGGDTRERAGFWGNVAVGVLLIGIDTGAFATGTLTAIAIEGSERWFLST